VILYLFKLGVFNKNGLVVFWVLVNNLCGLIVLVSFGFGKVFVLGVVYKFSQFL
jgi:hypothetical protein